MKELNHKRVLSLLVSIAVCISALALDVTNLRTQAYTNPVGIDITTPMFSWNIESEQRGVMQASYAIKVATDAAMNNVVWESGTVMSDASVDVEAKGFTLSARTRYYWQVSVTDNKGNKAVSTEKAYFETGLLKSSAWNEAGTKWIKITDLPIGSNTETKEIKDYEVEVDFQIKNLSAGIIFAASDHSNYYMWQINTETGTARFRPHRWQGGNPALLAENNITNVSIRNGETHKLRIEVRNANTATTYVDNVKIDQRSGNFTYGSFGFREDFAMGNVPEEAYFDNFKVTSEGETLLSESFTSGEPIFTSGSIDNGRLYVKGPGTYSWQQAVPQYVRFDVEADMTLINDNASIVFAATKTNRYMMWAINTFELAKPVVRRHVYNNSDSPRYSDTQLALSKSDVINMQHHIRLECETPYVRTYIDNVLVDTYKDIDNVLAIGDLGFRVSATGNERERAYFDNLKMTVYDSEGQAHVYCNEDFEGNSIFDGADIRTYNGSKQIYMEAPNGSAKRLMQSEGSVLPGASMMRKVFTLRDGIKSARLYATGLGVYNAYINGARVGQTDEDGNVEYDELKPGFTELRKTVFYTTHDVTRMLHTGDNAIGAEVTSGWYNGGITHGEYGNGDCAFRAMIVVTYEDGSEQIIPTDLTWSSNANGALRMGDIYNGEHYDARRESDWATASFDQSEWHATAESKDFKGEIRAFEGPQVKAVSSLARLPKSITLYEGTTANGTTFGKINVKSEEKGQKTITLPATQTAVYDFGQNAAGWVSFKVKGPRGAKVRFRFGEMLNTSGNRSRGDDGPDGSLYTENLRTAEATLYYTLKGETEGEAFHPTSTFFGFRYMEVTTTADVELSEVVGETVTSAMAERSTMVTSHEDINKLYSNIMWGQRSNFLSVPTDCPQRDERQGWTADTQIYSMAGLYNSDTRMFYEKWMRDMRDSQNENGAYPHIAPYAWNVGFGAAAWADAGVIVPYNVYLMTGDKQIIKDNWTSMEKYMQFLSTRTGDGYKYNGGETTYGDWVSFVETDSRYCSVCYYALVAQLMQKMALALSEKEGDTYAKKAETYQTLFENIRTEWQKRYLYSNGSLRINTQCAYLMALRYNLITNPEHITKARTTLERLITNNKETLNTGFLGTGIINQTLTENGLNDKAYNLLLQRNCPSWLYSIDQGATTIWERWNSYTVQDGYGPVSMNSFNHYSYGAVAEWMFRHMAGIGPDEEMVGFKHIILQPNPDTRSTLPTGQKRITSVDASTYTPYGEVKGAWQCDGGADITYNVTIPANTTATLILPVAEDKEIIEGGGTIAAEAEGVQYVGTENGHAIYNVGSGQYNFTIKTATSISPVLSHESLESTTCHNLQGIAFAAGSNVSKGVYIVNGKKIVK